MEPAGGVMQVTKGLSSKHGRERVRETPISEQAIIGAAIGAAMAGMRPVPEIMIMDFLAVCADQLVNHAAKLRFMSGGRTNVPMTIRCLHTYGRQVHDCLGVAAALDGEIDVEVLDLRSLVPWDAEAMIASVSKTRRAVVVHQAVRRCGVGAEIAAFLSEELWGTLLSPVLRVAGKDTPVPYAKELEDLHLPSAADITDAVRAVTK